MRLAALAVCVALAAATAPLAGGAAPQTALLRALADVRSGPQAHAEFDYADLAAVRRLAGYPPSYAGARRSGRLTSRWTRLLGVGSGNLAAAELVLAPRTGIDLFAADRAISIGQPPKVAVRIDGAALDTAKIERALRANGSKPKRGAGGREYLARGQEGSIDLKRPLTSLVLALLDRAVVGPHVFAASGFEEPVDEVLGGRPSLATVPEFATAAGCLGDVIAAQLVSGSLARVPDSALVAVGVRSPSGPDAPVDEVLCSVTRGAAVASRQAAALRRAIRVGGQAWSQGVTKETVAVRRGPLPAVQLVLTRGGQAPPGVVFDLLVRGDAAALLDG